MKKRFIIEIEGENDYDIPSLPYLGCCIDDYIKKEEFDCTFVLKESEVTEELRKQAFKAGKHWYNDVKDEVNYDFVRECAECYIAGATGVEYEDIIPEPTSVSDMPKAHRPCGFIKDLDQLGNVEIVSL